MERIRTSVRVVGLRRAPPECHASPWCDGGSILVRCAGGLLRRCTSYGPCPLLRRRGLVAVFPVSAGFPGYRLSAMSRTSNFDWSDSSLGVVQRFPSVDISAARPLPAPRPRERGQSPSARGCHTPNSFRPCRSSRLRRFSPRFALQVCCTLQPTMGFTTFPAHSPLLARTLPGPCGLGSWLAACACNLARLCSPASRLTLYSPHDVLPRRSARVGCARALLPAVLSGLAGPKTCLAIESYGRQDRVRPGASPFP